MTTNPPTESVKRHYERFPYPPVPTLALPRAGQGERLRYPGPPGGEGIRVLVAGAGTLEALVVAQAHPKAKEIVAVDLSERSLEKLRMRLWLARASLLRHRLPPIRLVAADLRNWAPDEPFDYILASNVLHHVEDPAWLLTRLSRWLRPEGTLRVVTYPKRSRIWMRETSRYLKRQVPGYADLSGRALIQACAAAIETLPKRDPVRSCFESQPEISRAEGLADAFFNPCENPLSPLEWEAAAMRAGLELVAEGQDPSSHSSFLTELLPQTARLTRWERLQILDDSLELCANPVFWFKKVGNAHQEAVDKFCLPRAHASPAEEMIEGLKLAGILLSKAGLGVTDLLDALAREVGPRVSTQGKILPGLSITEYPFLRDQFAEPLPEAAGAGAAEALSDLEAGAEAEDLRL